MKKYMTKRNVIIASVVAVVLICIPVFIGVQNYTAYNNYLKEFDKVGYENKIFESDNKLVKYETLNYMQSVLDNYINETNDKIKEYDLIIITNNLNNENKEGYKNITEEVISKEKIVKSYLEELNKKYSLNVSDINLENITNAVTKKVSDNINSIKLPSDKAYEKELNNFKSMDLSELALVDLIKTNGDIDSVKSKITDHITKIEEEKATAQAITTTSSSVASRGSNSSSNTRSNSSARTTSNTSSKQNSTSTPKSKPKTCAYKTEAAAISYGEKTMKQRGGGYSVHSCAGNTWRVKIFDGDNTGTVGREENSNLFD